MQNRLVEFKKINKENSDEQELINFLTHSLFRGASDVANLILEYREKPSINPSSGF